MKRTVIFLMLTIAVACRASAEDWCQEHGSIQKEYFDSGCDKHGQCSHRGVCADGQTWHGSESVAWRAQRTCGDVKIVWQELGSNSIYTWMDYGKACREAKISESTAVKRLTEIARLRPAKAKSGSAPVADAQLFFLRGLLAMDDAKLTWGIECNNGSCSANMPLGSSYKYAENGAGAWRFQVLGSPLSVDKEVSAVARKQGIKTSDKQLIGRILDSGATAALRGMPDRVCSPEENTDEIPGRAAYIAWMNRVEGTLIDGFRDYPRATAEVMKSLAVAKTQRYNHKENCKMWAQENLDRGFNADGSIPNIQAERADSPQGAEAFKAVPAGDAVMPK